MITKTKFQKTILFSLLACLGFSLNSMQAPQQRLSQSNFKAAAVLPYTRWKPKSKGGNAYFLLSREKSGRNSGTYDAFSGKRDRGEGHPSVTGGREFAEESLFILGSASSARNYIDLKNKNTKHVIARSSKNYVTYITKYSTADLQKLAKMFYAKLKNPKTKARSEKDALRWVKWADLEKAIIAWVPGRPVYVNAAKVDTKTGKLLKRNGKPVTESILLRPILVSMLRPLFTNQNYTPGKDPRIHFYN